MVKKIVKSVGQKSLLNWFLALCVILLAAFAIKYFLDMRKEGMYDGSRENYVDKEGIKIVYAYSKTCPHCIKFEKTFDVKSREFAHKIEEMNIDIAKIEKASLPEEYKQYVDGFPTVLVFKDGKFLKKTVGNMSGDDFINQLKSVL